LSLQDYVKLLRARWITVCVTIAIALIGAAALTLLTTPLYQASTRLFVSTTSSSSVSEVYQGNLFSQQRVLSYTQLLAGETLAQRTIDKLGLDMTPEALQQRIKASAKNDTVLIKVDALDESPVRARDIANTLSDEFVVMVRELETPADGARPDARVVVQQRASIPKSPVIPKTARNIGIGMVLGTVLGIGLAVLRGVLDNTVKDRETVEEITGIGLVGSIPFDRDRRKEPAISFDGDNFPSAEAFRKLRTNLQFLAVDNPPRVIVVASSMPHEGKTITAINIALALAETEHNVVLVDGDMRRPMLDKHLNLVGSVGFSTVLSGQATVEDALQKTRFPRLTALTSGPVPPNPSELLGSLVAQKVLDELRTSFDYVIVDSSPLLAVTDAAVLAANSDGVLVMARFGETKREQLAHAVGSLQDVGARLLGAVFTMVPARGNTPYSYYGSYGTYGTQQPADPEPPTESASARHRHGEPG
jgi:capsular exopolysaccharide synthesis family protein